MLYFRQVANITSPTNTYVSELASSGDLNCDGFPDLLFKSMYVVFGTQYGFPSLDLTAKTPGVNFIKITRSGTALDVGSFNEIKIIRDINGDGCDDLISGVSYINSSNMKTAAYVLFGNKDFGKSDIDVSKIVATQGFVMSEANPVQGIARIIKVLTI